MSAILERLTAAGVHVTAHGDRLHIEAAPGALTPDRRTWLAANKPEIMTALQQDAMRAKLRRIAVAEGIDPARVDELPAPDLAACEGLADLILRDYLRALRDRHLRETGRRPPDHTTIAICQGCGPIWEHPDIAKVAPIVDGVPRVIACPWCHVKNRSGMAKPELEQGKTR